VTLKECIRVHFAASFSPGGARSLGNVRQSLLCSNPKSGLDTQSTKKRLEPAGGLLAATIELFAPPAEKT
jgi:hypothetical protein